jgi:spore coat protein U-like protein
MKKVLVFALLSGSLTAFADDSALTSVTITGDNADNITSISSLNFATTGNSSFASGTISVSCTISTSLNPDEQSAQQHYSCKLAKSVQISGDDGDQIASLSFLSRGTAGNSSFVSGNIKVKCRISRPLNSENQPDQHYTCVLSQG